MSAPAQTTFLLALLLAALPALAKERTEWHETLTPHFRIMHQAQGMPDWLPGALEKLHANLRRDVKLFESWIVLQDRLDIFIYRDKASYLAAPFKPPAWSEANARYEAKAVATYLHEDRYKTMSLIAHECAHLALHGYWASYASAPPTWLDEGFAELLRGSATSQSDPRWTKSFSPVFKVRWFVGSSPKDAPSDKVAAWYAQAYSMTAFLYRRHSSVRFKKFCASLREGEPLENALQSAYGYGSLEEFESAWASWAKRKRGLGFGNKVRPSAVKPAGVPPTP
ncbi:MAG: hypothetical protein WC943_05860 [Elusimicrobiota bacterium]|jgi:hypothetical protein